MNQENLWSSEVVLDNEVVADHDELIAKLEADIIESKAFLSSLSNSGGFDHDLLY